MNKNVSFKNIVAIICSVVLVIIVAVLSVVGITSLKNGKTEPQSMEESTLPVTSQTLPQETTAYVSFSETTALPSSQALTQPASSAPVTQEPLTQAPTEPVTTQPPVTQLPTSAPSEKTEPTDEEILKAITDGINAVKAADASYVGTKTQNIVIDVTDCTYPAFLTIINGVVKLIANEEVLEYDFTNGKCIDPEEGVMVTANDTIPPVGTAFALTMAGVREAKYEKIGDNTKYSVTLVPETGTFEQPKPPHHGVACDTLDFSLFDVPVGEITKSDFNYPGAVITVTYDSNGKVIGYSEHIDMNGVGEGQAFGISASATLEGYIDESWVFVWK